jgi:KaiC/GvpD/RAD55 family RecA-like ATPase
MERVPSGVRYLDRELGGGFAKGSLVLLEYDTGSPSDLFLRSFVEAGLRSGEYCWVLSIMHPPRLIADDEEAIEEGRLMLIDGFTNAHGWKEAKSPEKYRLDGIEDIKHIHDAMRKAVEKVPGGAQVRGVLDSLTPIYISALDMENESPRANDAVCGFLHHQSVLAKKYGSCTAYTVHAPSHMRNPDMLGCLENASDYVLSMARERRGKGYKDAFTVKKARGQVLSGRVYGLGLNRGKMVLGSGK